MKKFHASLLLAGVLFLGACSDSGGSDSGAEIQLPAGTPTDYTIYADQTAGIPSEGISFTTTGPWRATVSSTRADASWVTVSPDHGDAAGDYTITVTLGVNTSGEDRSATITIECGSTRIVITIEQRGTTASGEIPELPEVGKRIARIIMISFQEDGSSSLRQEMKFDYDAQNRISSIGSDVTDMDTSTIRESQIVRFTYDGQTVAYESTHSQEPDWRVNGSIRLDDAGRAVSGEMSSSKGAESWSASYELFYDGQGRLVRSVGTGQGEELISWTDGNPTQVQWAVSQETLFDKAVYGTVANAANLDLNWFCVLDSEGWSFAVGDPTKLFALLGYTGQRASLMARSVTASRGGAEPDLLEFEYVTDDDGLPTEIRQKRSAESGTTHLNCMYTITYAE